MDKRLIRTIRDIEKLNQYQFAELVGVSRSTIAYIEAGYTPVSEKVGRKIIEVIGQDRVDKIAALIEVDK
nr:helix-turn-helix transcriptional regulator [Paenibacillus bovis]